VLLPIDSSRSYVRVPGFPKKHADLSLTSVIRTERGQATASAVAAEPRP
jgi:hypothetical protein